MAPIVAMVSARIEWLWGCIDRIRSCRWLVISGNIARRGAATKDFPGAFAHGRYPPDRRGAAERPRLPALAHALRGLIEQNPALLLWGRRPPAQFLAEIDAALHGGALFDGLAPARKVREFVERLAQRLRDQHPGPARHVD